MVLTKEQIAELNEDAQLVIGFLKRNCHPHVKVIIESDRVELVESVCNTPMPF